jgi:hypothetical protein
LPPPALTGRPRTFCSAQCREANERVVVSGRFEEKQRRDREQREAEGERREAERLRRAERVYQRAIAAGGDTAAEAKWQRRRLHGDLSLCETMAPSVLLVGCTERVRRTVHALRTFKEGT